MDRLPAPALLPAMALLAGAALSFRLDGASVPLVLGVAALALGLRRPVFSHLAWGCLGLVLPPLSGILPGGSPGHDLDRPTALRGRVEGHWRRGSDGWTAPLAVSGLRQGREVLAHPRQVWVTLPGTAPPPPFGSRLRLRGYLRRSTGLWNRRPTPQGPWRLRVKSRRLVSVVDRGAVVSRLSCRLRGRLEKSLGAIDAAGKGAPLLRALLLGDPGTLPDRWRRGLRRAGLAHLLAVSGLHVALLCAAVMLAGARLPRAARLLMAAFAVALYLLLVGPRPALVRASLMALLATGALLARRPPTGANALACAAAILAVESPELVADLGFQLTVGATAGLLLLAPPLAVGWAALPVVLRRPLAATVAAQIAVLPFSLPAFHLLTPLAVVGNLAAVPWTGGCLALALPWAGLALAAPTVATALVPLFDPLAVPFGWPAAATGTVGLALPMALGGAASGLLAGALAVALLRPRLGLALSPLLAAVCWWGGAAIDEAPKALRLVMLDVGQGDALLLRDGERALLLDGGGWEQGDLAAAVLLPALAAEGVRRLEAVALTHPDRDHCGGLLQLVDYLPVREVWTPPGLPAAGCGGELARRPGLRRRILWAGEAAALGRWHLTALHPPPGHRDAGNEGSLVLLAEGHGRRVLLTGDAGAPSERRLLREARGSLACDVLKVGHHGSRHSSSAGFLDAAAPRLALISVGRRNPYHHPSTDALRRLARRGVWVLRSDRHGMVEVRIDPAGVLRVHLPGRRPPARPR